MIEKGDEEVQGKKVDDREEGRVRERSGRRQRGRGGVPLVGLEGGGGIRG